MYISDLNTQIQPFVNLFTSLALSGAGVTLATQILKLDFIPFPAQKYPQLTAAIASIVAAVIVAYQSAVALPINGWAEWTAFVIGTYLLAAMIYNHIVKTVTLPV